KEKIVPKIFPGFPKQKEAKPPKRRARHAISVANKSKNFSGLNVAPTPVDQIQNNVEDDELQADIGLQLPLHHQEDEDDAMQTESIIRPPDMLCAIYSLPDANPAELDVQDDAVSSESYTNSI
ncbi:hypothetical protein B566_EDAN016158, partial [Ephemera danica]